MIVSPELMSASSAPSARPLKTCEKKLAQVNNAGTPQSLSQDRSGVVAELAAERVRLLHQAGARDDLDDVVVVLLALHVLLHLALHDDHRADALVVFGTIVHVADQRRDRLALLVGLDDRRRIEGAGLLDHV